MANGKTAKMEQRVTPEFKEAVMAAAAKAGLTMAVYTQQALLEKMYGFTNQTKERD